MKKLLILMILIAGCKKEVNPPIIPVTPAPIITTYTGGLMPGKNKGQLDDTLIVKVNGVVTVNKVGLNIPDWVPMSLKTGDELYIYFNPGRTRSAWGEDTVYNQNYLEVTDPYIRFSGERKPMSYVKKLM